jgi:hypothetical protein
MAGIKIVDLPPLGRDLASTDLLELSLAGGTGSRKITGQEIMNTSKLNIGTTAITSGVVGRVLFEGVGNVVSESANITWTDASLLFSLGSTATRILNFRPEDTTGAYGNSCSIRGGNGNGRLDFYSASNITELRDNIILLTSATGPSIQVGTGSINLNVASSTRLQVASTTGNVLIGTTTDAGFKLDVNGSFRATDGLFASSVGGYKLTVQQTGAGQGNTFRVIQLGYSMIDVNTNSVAFMPFPSTSGTVGITNWTSAGGSVTTFFTKNSEFTPQGGAQAIPLVKFPNVQSPIVMGATATADLRGYLTVSGSFNATSGLGAGQSLLPTLTATANNDVLIGLNINPTFTNGSFTGVGNYGLVVTGNVLFNTGLLATAGATTRLEGSLNLFSHNRIASSGIWGFDIKNYGGQVSFWRYNGGTGNTEIGSNFYGIEFYGNNTIKAFMTGGGNFLIGTTTDAGYKLDVNGTARVQGPSTYSMVYDSNGILNLNGTYARLDLFNQSGSLRARLNCDGPNGTLTLYQNATGYIFLNGAASGNNSYISTALSIGNQSAANASSILEVSSTTKGFLPPRMTQAQRNAIASPAIGLEIYQTDATEGKYIYKSSGWTYIG